MSTLFPWPFVDIQADDFHSLNKKHVSEHSISENFKKLGWKVYQPFTDTGIDLIITKKFDNEQIKRFIQVKTRELKANQVDSSSQFEKFGWTLSSKDIRTDPRHIFLLFSDKTQDVFIIPVLEYLKWYEDIRINYERKDPFSSPSFRFNNYKINSIFYCNKNNLTNPWYWGASTKIPFTKFLNQDGYDLINSSEIENHFDDLQNQLVEKRKKLLNNFTPGEIKVKTSSGDERKYDDANHSIVKNVSNEVKKHHSHDYNSKLLARRKSTWERLITDWDKEHRTKISQSYFKKFMELQNFET